MHRFECLFQSEIVITLLLIVLVDLNEFSSIFLIVQHSHSRHKITTSNLCRINLKANWGLITTTRGSYVHKPTVKFLEVSPNFLSGNFSNYGWLQTKQFTRLLEFIKLYKQNPLMMIFFFSHYFIPELHIGFNQLPNFPFKCIQSFEDFPQKVFTVNLACPFYHILGEWNSNQSIYLSIDIYIALFQNNAQSALQ